MTKDDVARVDTQADATDSRTASAVRDGSVHSPGPWAVCDGVVVSVPLDSVVMVTLKDDPTPHACHNGMVAIVYGHHVGDQPARCFTHDANARLIAAAPDLLEVARIEHELHTSGFTLATAQRLGSEAEHAYLCSGTVGLNKWRRQKRDAAIAKAEGRA